MTIFSIIMAATWLIAGVCVLMVGIKAGQGTLAKNKLIGIRTPELLASEEAWFKGHKAASPYLKISSVPLFIGAIICLFADDDLIGWVSIPRSEEHTSELQSRGHLVCRLLLEKKN